MAKGSNRRVRGRRHLGLRPDWRPLLELAPDEVPEFMWMFRVRLTDGTAVEAYKHAATRRYLHLDAAGRAYALVGDTTYEQGDPGVLLAEATEGRGSVNIVRHNEWLDGKKITWARSATRHRIPRAQTLFAIRHAGICFVDGKGRDGEPRLYFFGDDEQGRPLEIAAFDHEIFGLLAVHSMLLRRRFEERYREALKWRK
ncbi:MAG: hypothetical protein JSU06_09220 [Actinobacteria bacterium]|nr:hypothetical protein [Actinomycetota bacterium]